MQISSENEEQFQMLLMALEGTKQGICLFQTEDQSKWVSFICQNLGNQNVILHNIGDDDENTGLPDISDFKQWAGTSDAQIVIVYHLQLLGLRFGDKKAVEHLNYMRDQIQHIGKLFLFGVTPYFALLLSRSARDLYSCIRYHFKFLSTLPELHRAPTEDDTELNGDDVFEIEKYWAYKKEAANKTDDEQIRLYLECMRCWLSIRGSLPSQEYTSILRMACTVEEYFRKRPIDLTQAEQICILADTWLELEEMEKSLHWYQLITDTVKSKLGDTNQDYATALVHFANYYQQTGDYEQCEKYFDQAIQIYEENMTTLGEGYKGSYRIALLQRAILYRRKSQFQKALDIYETILKHDTQKYGAEYAENATCLNNMGRVYEELYDSSRALAQYQKALRLLLISGKKNHLLTTLYVNISCMYLKNGDTKNAWKNIKLAKKATETLYGTESANFIPIYNTIAAIWMERKQPDNAMGALNKALVLTKKKHVEETEAASFTYHNMGSLLVETGESLSAIPFLQHALKLRIKIYGQLHPLTASTCEGLCKAYYLLNDNSTCKIYLNKAQEIYAALYGENADKVKELNEFLADF